MWLGVLFMLIGFYGVMFVGAGLTGLLVATLTVVFVFGLLIVLGEVYT